MSEILVIVPHEWTPANYEQLNGLISYSWDMWRNIEGRSMVDVNEVLRPTGWLPAGKRLLDVMTINGELFVKFEDDLD